MNNQLDKNYGNVSHDEDEKIIFAVHGKVTSYRKIMQDVEVYYHDGASGLEIADMAETAFRETLTSLNVSAKTPIDTQILVFTMEKLNGDTRKVMVNCVSVVSM